MESNSDKNEGKKSGQIHFGESWLEDGRGQVEEHMEITERLTELAKGGSRKSYLEMENAALARVQESRRAVREREERERRKAQAEVDRVIREEEDGRKKKDE